MFSFAAGCQAIGILPYAEAEKDAPGGCETGGYFSKKSRPVIPRSEYFQLLNAPCPFPRDGKQHRRQLFSRNTWQALAREDAKE